MYRSYSLATLERLISDASSNGYTVVTVEEGSLGLGHMLLVAPRSGLWSFEIKEIPRNQWSSDHTLRRFTKISKRIASLI